MKNGYDQFFKQAQRVAQQSPKQVREAAPMRDRKLQSQDAKVLAEELRQRMRPKMQKKKTKKSIPWKFVGVSFVGLAMAIVGLLKMDQIEKMVKQIEVSMMGSAYAETTPATPVAAAAPTEKAEAKAEEPAKKEFTQEEINHFQKLNERRRELDSREEELARMEQELVAQKAELDKRLAELESTRRNISSILEEKVQADDKKVDNLVQMYSNMKPQQAAKAFEEMDEELAIEILGRMKKKNAAEIMNLVKSEKVKVLSEKYAGYKRN